MSKSLRAIAWLTVASLGSAATAQDSSSTIETGPDGVTYRVTRQVVQKTIPTTEYQTRQQEVYRPQVTTNYQSYQQTTLAPVTEYQWVPRLEGRWNPFIQPYWTHHLAPVTRWEARPTTVNVPVSRTDWVKETRTSQVPVTTYRTVPEEFISRVAVSATPSTTTAIASVPAPIGGQQLQSDPPRETSPWANSATGTYKR